MKSETKTIKHSYSHEERETLGSDLARAFGSLRGVENEFDQVKASYKSKTTEAEAKIDRISTNITNGFEMRDVVCVVRYRPADKEKDYYVESEVAKLELDTNNGNKAASKWPPVVLTEKMTADDFQQELIEAESKFDAREEIQLFQPVEGDRGLLIVGRLAGRWFSALRVKIGKLELNERLDAEQKAYKLRSDAVATAVKRVNEWAKNNLKDLAAGFQESFKAVAEANKERVE